MVRRLEDKKIIVDLAHASPRVMDDMLAMARWRVVVSHTGVQYTCPGPRNLSDAQISKIAANGGLIGVGYFQGAVCSLTPAAIVRAMQHVARLAGVALITQGLMDAKFNEEEIAAILGGNVQRLLLASLP